MKDMYIYIEYYATVKEKVKVRAESKEEAIIKCENGEFEQLPESTDVIIDWDSLVVV